MSPLESLPTVVGAEMREVVLPLRRPYLSAGTHMTERRLLLVRLLSDHDEGWGECGPIPGYSPETLDDCRHAIIADLERLVNGRSDETAPPPPPTARFAIEAALLDLASRMAGSPLWRHIGGTREVIPIGAVIGLNVPSTDLATATEWFLDHGYQRIKLKVTPGQDLERVAAVRALHPSADLAVDANGSYPPEDVMTPAALEQFELNFVEQPFPSEALDAAAQLAATMTTPVCLDESVTSIASTEDAIDRNAAGMINVKPARVGGIAAATAIHDIARRRGVPMWCGGMLESGIGKAAALAIASLPGMSLAADLPPSDRHYQSDIVHPRWAIGDGGIHLPSMPGLGVEVDLEVIQLATASIVRIGEAS